MPYADPEKAKEYAREWARSKYQKDVEAARAKNTAWRTANKDKRAEYASKYRAEEDPETRVVKDRIGNLRRYNLTLESFAELLASQGGCCAICGTDDPGPRTWHIDHDHNCCDRPGASCGECIRGLLCNKCNSGLGMFNDNIDSLLMAIAYLDRDS